MGASGGHGMMLRRGTGGYYVNGVVARWPADGVSLRDHGDVRPRRRDADAGLPRPISS